MSTEYPSDEYNYPKRPQAEKPAVALPLILFLVTIVTTMTSGALYQGADIFNNPYELTKGIPFSLSLLLILGTHEFGHFITSKMHGVSTTFPIFIPGPPIPPMIGTFGAVIRMKSVITRKNALIDIGASGPLSGFLVSIAVTLWGLSLSTVMPVKTEAGQLGLGTSLIFQFLSYLVFGNVPDGQDVYLHSVAFAGWIGMFVTAMNLLPIGQLDGGHIAYAILGRRHRFFSLLMLGVLVILGIFTWPGWFVWAVLVSLIGTWHPPVEDPYEPIDGRRRAISWATLFVFVLTFIPTPFYIV